MSSLSPFFSPTTSRLLDELTSDVTSPLAAKELAVGANDPLTPQTVHELNTPEHPQAVHQPVSGDFTLTSPHPHLLSPAAHAVPINLEQLVNGTMDMEHHAPIDLHQVQSSLLEAAINDVGGMDEISVTRDQPMGAPAAVVDTMVASSNFASENGLRLPLGAAMNDVGVVDKTYVTSDLQMGGASSSTVDAITSSSEVGGIVPLERIQIEVIIVSCHI
jgi:hypothetical protein